MNLLIIEGIRRSGKSYVFNLLKEKFSDLENGYIKNFIFYKDPTANNIFNLYKKVDVDDAVIGRDISVANFIAKLNKSLTNHTLLVLDRSYPSSFVYGQFYRNKYDKQFWKTHIKNVENIYSRIIEDKKMLLLFIDPSLNFKKISMMDRNKDQFETNEIESYKQQYNLYLEFFKTTKIDIDVLPAFSEDEKIIDKFQNLLVSYFAKIS